MSFTLVDSRNNNTRVFESRAEADEKAKGLKGLVNDPSDIEVVKGSYESYAAYENNHTPETEDVNPEIIDHTAESDGGETQPEPQPEPQTYDLPDKPPVDEDPLTWMPSEFTDQIDGSVAINRKGYEVMAHHYGIETRSSCMVGPEETEFSFCRVKATAITDDGKRYQAHGSAHVDRGDDAHLLLEMADTRARKRAIAQATGVGMVAVSELQNNL
jgi:hypothetical protein